MIMLESILRIKEYCYHPQIFLEECKHDVNNIKRIDVLIMTLIKAHLINQIMYLMVRLIMSLIVVLIIINVLDLLRNLISFLMNLKLKT